MYDTTLGIRVLHDSEARLFANACWSLTDDLRCMVPNLGGQSFNHLIGIPVLEPLTAAQVIVLIDRVSAYLLDPTVAAPPRTAVLDATIAAVFQQVADGVEGEIQMQSVCDLLENDDDDTMLRRRVAEASTQTSGPDDSVLDTPDPECVDMETWQFVIDRLCDRVLSDTDWQLEPILMDVDPQHGSAVKRELGIQEDYFIDVVPDASVEVAASAWCDLIERISGLRPEKWRFGGGLEQPEDAGPAPRVDVLPFASQEQAGAKTDKRKPHFQHAKPIVLDDVIFEMEGTGDDWSSYVDRRNGEIVRLPSAAILSVEAGEDPQGYDDEGGQESLELARRIVQCDDFVPLPRNSDVDQLSIMRDFCNTIESDSDRQELLGSIHGSGEFRLFNETIERLGLQYEWYCHKDGEIRRIVIDWLEEHSIQWSWITPDEAPF